MARGPSTPFTGLPNTDGSMAARARLSDHDLSTRSMIYEAVPASHPGPRSPRSGHVRPVQRAMRDFEPAVAPRHTHTPDVTPRNQIEDRHRLGHTPRTGSTPWHRGSAPTTPQATPTTQSKKTWNSSLEIQPHQTEEHITTPKTRIEAGGGHDSNDERRVSI
jgi:hypothetical protein